MGEWATTEGKPTPTLNAALGDAAWMTGMERNADVVIMHCYAPLLVNVNPGAAQWGTNLIGYDALTSFGSPSYYAQKMFSENRGDTVLPVEVVPQAVQPATSADAAGRDRRGDLAHAGGVQGYEGDAWRHGAVPGGFQQGADGLAARHGASGTSRTGPCGNRASARAA